MRRLTRGRAATDDEATPPEGGASDAVGDAAHAEPAPAAAGDETRPDEAVTIVAAPDDASTTAAEGDDRGRRVGASGSAAAASGNAAATGGGDPATSGGDAAAGGSDAGAGGEDATAATAGTTAAEAPDRDLPAGLDAGTLAAAPVGSARRGRVRRRLLYLRHARELLLRDLGGFYYEAHRSESGASAHGRLLEVKARRLALLDAEVRELEERLGAEHPQAVLREPGIGGTCPHCGELHGSDARFCPRCGSPLRGRAARRADADPAPVGVVEEQGRPTTASLWGRRRTPAPPDPTQAAGHDQLRAATDDGEQQPTSKPDEDAATSTSGENAATSTSGEEAATSKPGEEAATSKPGEKAATSEPGDKAAPSKPGENASTAAPGEKAATTEPGESGGASSPTAGRFANGAPRSRRPAEEPRS